MTWADYIGPLSKGAWVTVQLAVWSTFLGALLSFVFGTGKLSSNWAVKGLSIVYIEVFRGTSLLVQLFWLFYALPIIGLTLSPLSAGILGLSLNIGAYGAEVVRGALEATSRGQREAAIALNFTPRQTLWRILLPQALLEMMPPFGNLAVQNLKDSALVSLITLADLTYQAQNLRNITLQTVPILTLTLLLYFAMALLLTAAMRWLERRVRYAAGYGR